jgi:hypothetical protein
MHVSPAITQEMIDTTRVTARQAAWEASPYRDQFADIDEWDRCLYSAAIESERGSRAATMKKKKAFLGKIFRKLKAEGHIHEWTWVGGKGRHDYDLHLPDGRIVGIEAKGCLDGNSSTIFDRPSYVDEFYVISMAGGTASNTLKNLRSGLNRITVELISRRKKLDGVLLWDEHGSAGRAISGITDLPSTDIDGEAFLPPAVFAFPRVMPHPDSVRSSVGQDGQGLTLVEMICKCFALPNDLVRQVDVDLRGELGSLSRKIRVRNGLETEWESRWTPIRREVEAYR